MMLNMNETGKELGRILSALTGRTVRTEEIVSALGVARSTYYLQLEEGRLYSADNLIRLAQEFNINPVELMLHCELISAEEVKECAAKKSAIGVRKKKLLGRIGPRQDLPPI